MASFSLFMDVTAGGLLNDVFWVAQEAVIIGFSCQLPCCLCNIGINTAI